MALKGGSNHHNHKHRNQQQEFSGFPGLNKNSWTYSKRHYLNRYVIVEITNPSAYGIAAIGGAGTVYQSETKHISGKVVGITANELIVREGANNVRISMYDKIKVFKSVAELVTHKLTN